MNSDQIERILTQDPYTKHVFKEVCPRDRLPASISYPSAFVLNTDPSWRRGEHWIAVYFDENKRGEFMDSYGLNSEFYNFDSFTNENATNWSCNSKSIQNPLSVVCGHYCVYQWFSTFFKSRTPKLSYLLLRTPYKLTQIDTF